MKVEDVEKGEIQHLESLIKEVMYHGDKFIYYNLIACGKIKFTREINEQKHSYGASEI